ncbi:MAG: glycosyltransferase, partial [Actinomycetales bacterium]
LVAAKKQWPVISVVIPARDEEVSIEASVRASAKLFWPKVEIVVVNDGSIDKTGEILNSLKSELDFKVVTHNSPQGKSVALNDGMRAATSEIVLILDADAIPARNVLIRMVPHLII